MRTLAVATMAVCLVVGVWYTVAAAVAVAVALYLWLQYRQG